MTRYSKQIERARKEAARLAVVLANRFAASGCEQIDAHGATLVYERAGRVYHVVVHDMGTIEHCAADDGRRELEVSCADLRLGDRLLMWRLSSEAKWQRVDTDRPEIIALGDDQIRTSSGTYARSDRYQWKIERSEQPSKESV